ncbi:MAG: DUF4326 domain-containing protein [Thaumarchaeota archaeon]|nr:DUF4326 domain-containing protein [Nitrososphaerota archaeon]
MTNPVRVQRRRTKGWKMPPNTVYVGRPTIWGNPWKFNENRDTILKEYRRWLLSEGGISFWHRSHSISELRGKNLACWCPLDQPCHADILLELANQ